MGTCGNEGIWTIDEGNDYPRLAWEGRPGEAISLSPLSDLLVGTGTESDPFLIYTAEELYLIRLFPCEWDKRFKLMADVDLSDYDGKEGRPGFEIIAPDRDPATSEFDGISFTGIFDGNGHTISHLTINGGSYLGLFGQLGKWPTAAEVRDLGLVGVNVSGSGDHVGGLVGDNFSGSVTRCYSTGAVTGNDYVGGLVGNNRGRVAQCYSSAHVWGDRDVGGLVGQNYGHIATSYSTGAVIGKWDVGGLVGRNGSYVTYCYSIGTVTATGSAVGGMIGAGPSVVIASFWDMQTSGQATSAGGTGKTTAEMQTAKTFLDAGWDFVGETANGTEDIWWINEGKDYPCLWWQTP